jgi:bifunctional DNA primase/polymerase-like protein
VTTGAGVLVQLTAHASSSVPATYTVTGGQHLYFRQPPSLELCNSAGRLGWKIDTRGHGGYVLAAARRWGRL